MRASVWAAFIPLLAVCVFLDDASAQSLDEAAETATRDIVAKLEEIGLQGVRGQLYAPGKTEEEKDAIVEAAVEAFAECIVETSIEFAHENGISAITLLRWQTTERLTNAERAELRRVERTVLDNITRPCEDAFVEALPM